MKRWPAKGSSHLKRRARRSPPDQPAEFLTDRLEQAVSPCLLPGVSRSPGQVELFVRADRLRIHPRLPRQAAELADQHATGLPLELMRALPARPGKVFHPFSPV